MSDTRDWLDDNHPERYGVARSRSLQDQIEELAGEFGALTGAAIEEAQRRFGAHAIDVFLRCPRCEEWAPCRVRAVFVAFHEAGAPGAPPWWDGL